MKVRRVETGHDDRGKSVFTADDELDPVTIALGRGIEFLRVWGAESVPTAMITPGWNDPTTPMITAHVTGQSSSAAPVMPMTSASVPRTAIGA